MWAHDHARRAVRSRTAAAAAAVRCIGHVDVASAATKAFRRYVDVRRNLKPVVELVGRRAGVVSGRDRWGCAGTQKSGPKASC